MASWSSGVEVVMSSTVIILLTLGPIVTVRGGEPGRSDGSWNGWTVLHVEE